MIALLSSWINYGLIIVRAYRGDHAMRRFVIMPADIMTMTLRLLPVEDFVGDPNHKSMCWEWQGNHAI